jgi:adenylate cyclase
MSTPIPLTRHRICVLLIDDQAIIGQAVERMLGTENDIDFHYCSDPTQALQVANQVRPTVILQDLVMPEMEGLLLVRYFRANPSTREVPLIVLSSKEEAQTKAEAFALGANDYMVKLPDKLELCARIRYHSKGYIALLERNEAMRELEKANHFIRQTFGRYLSDDVVDTILESPEGLKLGGEKRLATIMMTDLRGFTAICERLPAETVVAMLNIYLEEMTEIIFKYQGTIDEFIGDAILAVFGAPIQRNNDAHRAVACALEMQLVMEKVNQRNLEAGYPEVQMGIGINSGELVVGNIGSSKRTKYGVVGRTVNIASRVESYTVGGQVLISESTLAACGPILRIDDQMEVMPKGVKKPITISEVGGIGGEFNIFLEEKKPLDLYTLAHPMRINFSILAGKHAGDELHSGTITRMSRKHAELEAGIRPEKLSNLKITLFDDSGTEVTSDLYAKVTETLDGTPPLLRIMFTSIPLESQAFIEKILFL